jgi:SAM-dependent methyltransferase
MPGAAVRSMRRGGSGMPSAVSGGEEPRDTGGRQPGWDPELYGRNASFVPELGRELIDVLDPRPGHRILDLGCGDGRLTLELAARGAHVVGVDAAPAMVAAARARGVDARLADARRLPFDAEFDAVFSNAALHWMGSPEEVLVGVRRALRPGGRFVGEFGGHTNIAAIVVALLAVLQRRGVDGRPLLPWYYPTAEEYGARLRQAGFAVDSVVLFPRPTPLPSGVGDWLDTFAGGILAHLPEGERRAARDEAVELMRWSLCDAGGHWTADYVRLRFAAHVPEGGG